MALSVIVVAGPGWDPDEDLRESLPSSFEIEVVPYRSISMPKSRQWRHAFGPVFVDKPSIGDSTVEVVTELERRVDASIVVLDEDPDPADIVGAIMAGADLYAPRDLMTGLVSRWSDALTRGGAPMREIRSGEEVVKGYAVDAIQAVARVPAIHRMGALSDALLKSVTGDITTARPLLHRARASFESQLLQEFANEGVGDTSAVAKGQPQGGDTPEPTPAPGPEPTQQPTPPTTEPTPTAAAPPPQLFWNTRFPNDDGILRNKPHLVVARAEYLLETSLGPAAQPGAATNPQDSADLLGKEIAFRLEAHNGEFRVLNLDGWQASVLSSPRPCSESGTDPFRVCYRARSPGEATIDAFLLVDNGSVDQLRIALTSVGTDTEIESTRTTEDPLPSRRPAGRAVTSAIGADYALYFRGEFADLLHRTTLIAESKRLPSKFAAQVSELAAKLYGQLRELSRVSHLAVDPERPLRLQDPDDAALRLAQIGARLHHSLFISPIRPLDGGLPEGMRKIAECLRDAHAAPPLLLQIQAADFPVPWGLLYDRSSDGGADLKSVDDVDPNGFWGRRFDIYRLMIAVDREAQRGARRLVKPVVGASVPRGDEQRLFLASLRSQSADNMLVVQETCSTPSELETWATSGDDSDLLYFFCHARPERLDEQGSTVPSALGLGADETESRTDLCKLRDWWPSIRPTNPVVFVNACSSGQQDLIHGTPFAEFFLYDWQAQAFLGTDWPVNPGFADVFGQRVLHELLTERASLRTALRTVSDEAAEDGNFFPLMYAVYGSNSVQFADPARAV